MAETYRTSAKKARAIEPATDYSDTGPEKLARQPAQVSDHSKQRIDPNWKVLRQHLEARLNMGRSWRYSWMTNWELLESYILPARGIFINATQPTPNTMVRGVTINQTILDPTGTKAMRVCAAGLMSALMSPGRPWFKLKPALFPRQAVDKAADEWFSEVEDRMYQVMARSNFYATCAQMFEDLTTFATAPMIIYEDDKELIRCYLNVPGEYILFAAPTGENSAIYRQFVWTVAQIVEFFGVENCPADVQSAWMSKGSGLETERVVCHALEPNFPVQLGLGSEVGVVKGGFTWREIYWVWGAQNDYPLSMAGFWESPAVVPRWATTSNDPYGRGIGMDNLGDIMQLQVMTGRLAEALEKLVRPPMKAHVSMKNEPSSILPGHITYLTNMAEGGMAPIFTVNPQVKEMAENIMQIQERIKSGFLNDLFLMQAESTKDMTAYEVAQRQQEKLQVLGPVQERWQSEFASPAIKRIYRIMERKRLIPPPPPSLQSVPLDIEYVSMLAQAQKASATTAMERYAQVAGNLGAVYPEAKFSLDPAQFMQEYGQLIGVPVEVMHSLQEVAQLMDQYQKQMQAQQAAGAAQAAVQGAQTLSQTDVGGGTNALAMLAGRTGSGAQPANAA